MSEVQRVSEMLADKDAGERVAIAQRTGAVMRSGKSWSDQRGAEELARQLACDAVEVVRRAIAREVARNPYLPKDIAKRIAHDVDAIAVPFLTVTEVFDDEELAQLALTLSQRARAAVAARDRVAQPLCRVLCEIGDNEVAHCLAQNPGADLTEVEGRVLWDRFEQDALLMQTLAERGLLPLDLVETLVCRVERVAAKRIVTRYGMPDFTAPIVPQARIHVLMEMIRRCPTDALVRYAEQLKQNGELCPYLVIRSLKLGCLEFFEAAMSVLADIPLENARRLTREGGRNATARLSHKAEIPAHLRKDLRDSVEFVLAERAARKLKVG
mgnify:CR=1 FL=1